MEHLTYEEITEILLNNDLDDQKKYSNKWLLEKMVATEELEDYEVIEGIKGDKKVKMVSLCLMRITDELNERGDLLSMLEEYRDEYDSENLELDKLVTDDFKELNQYFKLCH
jgi:hypothetical protein